MRRRFLGLHLATWGVIALAAGVMVWVNLRWQPEGRFGFSKCEVQGWPENTRHRFFSNVGIIYEAFWNTESLAVNAVIAAAIIFACAVTCEWLIRRLTTNGSFAPRFQFHLSTYIILMLALSALQFANMSPQLLPQGYYLCYGFPFWCYINRAGLEWFIPRLAANIIVCFSLLAAFAIALEWAIRRGKANRANSEIQNLKSEI